jgi:hypothetical protein
MRITTRRAPDFSPLNLARPILILSQCRVCGAVFAKSQPAEAAAEEETLAAY